jgi:hypothetical protein
MRELLENKADLILQGIDLKTWKQTSWKSDCIFYALLFWFPLQSIAFEGFQSK